MIVVVASGSEPDPPRHMADLPRDSRGFIIPAETPWEGEEAYLSRYDVMRTLALAAARACAVCGLPLLEGTQVWRVFTQRDAALARIDGDITDDLSAPGHESCMLYSTLVCPFWRTPQSRLGKESLRAPGAKRGTKPAMLGYDDAYLLVEPGKDLLGTQPPPFRFLYAGKRSDVRFTDAASDLWELYQESQERDDALLELAAAGRFYWTGTLADRDHLFDYLAHTVPEMLKRHEGPVEGGGVRYERLRLATLGSPNRP